MRGHAGTGHDAALGYRSMEEINSWASRCPVDRLGRELLEQNLASEGNIDDMSRRIQQEIDEAFEFARTSPLPQGQDLMKYLFKE